MEENFRRKAECSISCKYGEKEKPLAIGKAARPRAFASTDIKNLPVNWLSNTKPRLTRDVMTQWLKYFVDLIFCLVTRLQFVSLWSREL